MSTAFSRLQLAAALLEYDNDLSDPNAPYRSAHDSAIFAHLRVAQPVARRSMENLGTTVPSEIGSAGGRDSVASHRKSQGSINALRNPFGQHVDEEEEEVEEEHEVEVDLASWGLDAFMPKEKGSKHSKGKSKSEALTNPHPVPSLRQHQGAEPEPKHRRPGGPRSSSLGNMDSFGVGGAFLDSEGSDGNRRRSIGSALEINNNVKPRRVSSHALIESIPPAAPLHSIPFPTSSVRSRSPGFPDDARSTGRPMSRASVLQTHGRRYSSASMGSRPLLDENDPNSFAVRPPSPDRASRFDPKARSRTMSNATMGTMASQLLTEDNPFTVRPPSPSRSSRFDPKAAAHARTISNASMGMTIPLENDGMSTFTRREVLRDRPYSTIELMRPKVLIMPSPLQSAMPQEPSKSTQARDGFQLSSDGPPLPPGARSGRRSSMTLSMIEPEVPIASNQFTPNPRMSLTLSQLTFRNSLMIGGQRDVAYADIDNNLPRATADGEQANLPEIEEVQVVQAEVPIPVEEPVLGDGPPSKQSRPAGKLYGRSLIDDLENRKAEMRSKQRVFKGDERPSMMARGPLQRSSTLIDPASLQQRPASQHLDSSRSMPTLERRNSTLKPLLNFDDGPGSPSTPGGLEPRIPKSRSVFGVDTLWEREMAKLKEIEARERREAEERQKREAEEEALQTNKKGKKKGRSKGGQVNTPSPVSPEKEPRVSAEPPVLPVIPKATTRAPPPVANDDEESESDSDESAIQTSQPALAQAEAWLDESDEEKPGPKRTTGTGPRYPQQTRSHPQAVDDDSEEDLPLVAAIERVAQRATRTPIAADDDDEEEKPLSALLEKTKFSLLPVSFGNLSAPNTAPADDDDEDNTPLGLRASTVPPQALSSFGDASRDDDDRPLALHPEQQRRTQYQMMAAQAAQQQQMMMQAQFQSSMFFNPSMMGSGFFGPSMGPPPPMMIPPQQVPAPMPSPPPLNDSAKYGLVDRWRHDVAVEGKP